MKFSIPGLLKTGYNLLWRFFNEKRFLNFGSHSLLVSPLRVAGHQFIFIGNSVLINYKTSLVAAGKTGIAIPTLKILDGTVIGNFNHIYATSKIVIGAKVLTADRVYISDNLHSYSDISVPIMDQPILQNGEVIIGDGTWIGENVCILGVKIGKNCVIGANSVVTKDVPDFSVAVGAPAKIIKRYCITNKSWLRTNPDGSFAV